MQQTQEDKFWVKEEARLRKEYGGLRCPHCEILLISKYAAECRKTYYNKPPTIPDIPKPYFVEIKLKEHHLSEERKKDYSFLNGEFLGLHLIRNKYCISCDTDESQCIFCK